MSVGACMGVCEFQRKSEYKKQLREVCVCACVCACMSVRAFKGVDENAMRERKKDKSILE